MLTIAIDANFGLCRKGSAGKSVSDPKTKMFVDQRDVDSFVQNYSSHSKASNMDRVSYENVYGVVIDSNVAGLHELFGWTYASF